MSLVFAHGEMTFEVQIVVLSLIFFYFQFLRPQQYIMMIFFSAFSFSGT